MLFNSLEDINRIIERDDLENLLETITDPDDYFISKIYEQSIYCDAVRIYAWSRMKIKSRDRDTEYSLAIDFYSVKVLEKICFEDFVRVTLNDIIRLNINRLDFNDDLFKCFKLLFPYVSKPGNNRVFEAQLAAANSNDVWDIVLDSKNRINWEKELNWGYILDRSIPYTYVNTIRKCMPRIRRTLNDANLQFYYAIYFEPRIGESFKIMCEFLSTDEIRTIALRYPVYREIFQEILCDRETLGKKTKVALPPSAAAAPSSD